MSSNLGNHKQDNRQADQTEFRGLIKRSVGFFECSAFLIKQPMPVSQAVNKTSLIGG